MPIRSWCCRTGASSSAARMPNCLTCKANTRACGHCSNSRPKPRKCSRVQAHCSRCPTENHFTLVLGTTAYCLILFAFLQAVVQTATQSMLQSGHELPITNKPLAREDSAQCKENF